MDEADDLAIAPEGCAECGKGTIVNIDLLNLIIKTCDVCDHRAIIKKK